MAKVGSDGVSFNLSALGKEGGEESEPLPLPCLGLSRIFRGLCLFLTAPLPDLRPSHALSLPAPLSRRWEERGRQADWLRNWSCAGSGFRREGLGPGPSLETSGSLRVPGRRRHGGTRDAAQGEESDGQVHRECLRPGQRAVRGAVPAAGARAPLPARAGPTQGGHAALGGAEPGRHLHRGVRLQRREEPGGQRRALPQRGGAAQAGHQHPGPHERRRAGPQPRGPTPAPALLSLMGKETRTLASLPRVRQPVTVPAPSPCASGAMTPALSCAAREETKDRGTRTQGQLARPAPAS